MKILTFCLLLVYSNYSRGQEVISISNGERLKEDQVESFLRDLIQTNDHVVSFRILSSVNGKEMPDYFVLAKTGKNLFAYNYLQKSKKLKRLNVTNASLELVWKTFIQNDLFDLRNEKDIPNFCAEKYQIYSSHTYEFVLLNKTTIKKLLYYDPEYYDEACYGMIERKKIINSVAVITHVLDQ